MRGFRVTAAVAVGAALAVATAAAGPQAKDSAVVTVIVHVGPRLSVETTPGAVDTETEADGRFAATVGFHVGANRPRVAMSAAATHLYKGSDPASPAVPLATEEGVEIAAGPAVPSGGEWRVIRFVGTGAIGEFPAVETERVTFESPDAGRFDRHVRLRLRWERAGARNPPGDYGGRINLTAMLLP